MPVQRASSAGQMSSKLVTIAEPYLQRRKKVPFGADQPFTMKPCMEPVVQSKKRVQPNSLKSSLAKSEFDGAPLKSKKRVPFPPSKPTEPVMQAKKRVLPEFVAQTHHEEPAADNLMQSKKKVDPLSSEKPMHCEPPLQSKRRSQGPTTTLSNGFYGNGEGKQEEYALLGNQDKFSENVKYRPRSAIYSRDISPPKQMKIQKKYKENRDPSPAPVVDTEQFRKPMTPLAPRRPKYHSSAPVQELKESNLVKEPKVTRSPKQSQSEPRMSKTKIEEDKEMGEIAKQKVDKVPPKEQKRDIDSKITKMTHISKVKKVVDNELHLHLNKGEEAKNFDRKDPMKNSMKSKRIVENMNEFAQTNMDKGVADSAPEAPAEYALKYKTGISAPRPTKKVSEYQKQFQWKSGVPASPLLKAEQVVYNSNPQLSPPKKSVIPKVTEYQKQFKVYKLIPVAKEDPEPVPKKGAKLQRSKSMDDLSPADIKAAGSSPVISPVNKRLTLETDQIIQEPVPELPRKKCRQVRSEYRSNFKEPNQFDYLRGSWQGAAPPHVQIKGPEDTAKAPALANWFAEVIELRRKAQEYRQRALGTHFSREHMAQLMARQNDLWESSTPSARSTLSALSLESGLGSHRQFKEQPRSMGRAVYSTAATLASEDDQSTARLEEVVIQGQKKRAWMEQEDADEIMSLETPSTFTSECLDAEGRLPTPKIREQIQFGGIQHRRHHLDRTTPSVGGAILSSPPDSRKKNTGKRMVSRSVDSASVGSAEVDTPKGPQVHSRIAGQQTYCMSATKGTIAPTPTFGMPSRDTHALRDDDASTDRQLQTQFVYSAAPSKNTPGGLSAIGEGYGATYNKSKPDVNKMQDVSWTLDGGFPPPEMDDDVLSVSMQSIASSCSLASDTLQRARKRKEQFWGTHTVKAT